MQIYECGVKFHSENGWWNEIYAIYLRNFVHFLLMSIVDVCLCTTIETWHTVKWKFCLIYETICNGKNKGELVECRLCLEDTMPCQLVSQIILLIMNNIIIFSCPIDVDGTFCCSKVKYSLLLKVTEYFTAVSLSDFGRESI